MSPDGYVLASSSSRVTLFDSRSSNRRLLEGLSPEIFEELVGPTAEEHGAGSPYARRGSLGLLVVGHDPVQVAVGTGEVAIGGEPVERNDTARGGHA
jgi:hypothetical protein